MPAEIIRAKYDELDQIAARFAKQAQSNADMIKQVQRAMNQLQQNGWVGKGSEAFFNEMQSKVLPACQRLVGALQQSQTTTKKIVEVVKQAEEEAANLFKGGGSADNITKNTISRTDKAGSESFNWWGPTGSAINLASELLKFAKDQPYEEYKSIGRMINKAIGNKKAGWVGNMDELGHQIKGTKGKGLGHALDGLSILAGIGDDIGKGYSLDKSVITELAEFGTGKLVEKGAEKLVIFGLTKVGGKALYAVPYVGQAMMVYDGAIIVGNLAAGGLELAGYHEQAKWLQNKVDKVDISYYIGEGMDKLYDYAAPAVKDFAGDVIDKGTDLAKDAFHEGTKLVGGTVDKGTDLAKDAFHEGAKLVDNFNPFKRW